MFKELNKGKKFIVAISSLYSRSVIAYIKGKDGFVFLFHLVLPVTGHEQALARVSTDMLNEVSRMCHTSAMGSNQSHHSSDVHGGNDVSPDAVLSSHESPR